MKLVPATFDAVLAVAGTASSQQFDFETGATLASKLGRSFGCFGYGDAEIVEMAKQIVSSKEVIAIDAVAVSEPATPSHVSQRFQAQHRAWEEINSKLNQSITLKLDDVPIRDAMQQIVSQIGARLVVDEHALEQSGVAIEDTKLSLDLVDVAAETALRQVLQRANLGFVIDGDVLKVTSQDAAQEHLTTRVYPVSDLVVPSAGGDAMPGLTSLMATIQQTNDGPWYDIDGSGGTVSPHFYGGVVALAIRQTDEIHREIETLLYQLRQARSPAAQKALDNAAGSDVSRVEREILRLRDEVRDTAEGVRSRVGALKIQELTPELRAKIEELQTDSRLERLRSEMRSLAPTVRERLEELRRTELEVPRPDLESRSGLEVPAAAETPADDQK